MDYEKKHCSRCGYIVSPDSGIIDDYGNIICDICIDEYKERLQDDWS